jgi:tetratricopeptide (TPR) repeat protein
MSEAHPSDTARAAEPAGADRDAKIEQLLLVGLDQYFAGRYEQAINVWTRALFLDRSHARARAYIERARTALAEGQRESEELLQSGVAAFHRGESDEARRLLLSAIDRGAPSEEALAVLERLDRLDAAVAGSPDHRPARAPSSTAARGKESRRNPVVRLAGGAVGVILVLAVCAYAIGPANRSELLSLVLPEEPVGAAVNPIARETVLPVPRRGELALTRAKALAAAGRLRDALAALDAIRLTDPEHADADRLRSDIQRQLLALAPVPPVPAPRVVERHAR